MRGWGNETTEIILRHINEWAVLLSVLLILVGATQKKFTERIEQQGGRVISMPKDNLPHDGCYLVFIEDEVKRESSKLNHDLVLAYRRRWKIVKPSFIDWATKEKRVPTFSEHAVDLSPLEALSSGTCGAVQQSVDQLRFRLEVMFLTMITVSTEIEIGFFTHLP